MSKILALTVGSVTGGLLRYYLAGAVHRVAGTNFPYGTLVVNLLGCLVIGFLSVVAEEKFSLGPTARLLLMTGFCGAFTTFSTFILETGNLLKDGQVFTAAINILASVIIGFAFYRVGILIGEII